jgi:hypothetical protein
MENADREVFRRSWLTLTVEWALALTVASTVVWAYVEHDPHAEWKVAGLAALPLVWALSRTVQWFRCTLTATADRLLIIEEGVLFRSCQIIHLCSARGVTSKGTLLLGWLGIGRVNFRATDPLGQFRAFQWTWLARHARLCEIVEARGQLPVGRPSKWQLGWHMIKSVSYAGLEWVVQVGALVVEMVVRLQGRWFVDDYGRFLAFCHHLLRNVERDHSIPRWAPPAVTRRWIAVLRRAHIVVDAPNSNGWCIARSICGLEDVRHRIGREELRRAVREPVGRMSRRHYPVWDVANR